MKSKFWFAAIILANILVACQPKSPQEELVSCIKELKNTGVSADAALQQCKNPGQTTVNSPVATTSSSVQATTQPTEVSSQPLSASSQPTQPAATSFEKKMTGMVTNMSVQLLAVKRIQVENRNDIVLVQYRLRKEGEKKGELPGGDDLILYRFDPQNIKGRDTNTNESFEYISLKEHNTYSNPVDTTGWNIGQQGDGFVWLKVPKETNTLDILFPTTSSYEKVQITS